MKLVLPVAIIVIVGAASTLAYVTGTAPFERRGDIRSQDVCESLGNARTSAAALQDVLPKKSDYTFEDKIDGETVAQGGSSYTADCLVWGEGAVLLSARTQMLIAEPSRSWVAEGIGDELVPRAKSFKAGDMGVIAGGKAAVLVPCSAPGSVVGGSYSLSVVVNLRNHTDVDQPKLEERLVDLALGAARFAHKDARCDLPSKIPDASPAIGGKAL
jgi:hypothetical protein